MYQHQTIYQQLIGLPVGKVVCVGRNYAEHAKELGNEIPITPILFLKPSTSIVCLEDGFSIPTDQGCVHHEAEISLLVDKRTKNISAEQAWSSVSHVGLALDLTLRDLQSKLKEKSHPWEIAKAFDGACPLSKWIPVAELSNKEDIAISLEKDGELKQVGSSMQMITNIPQLIAYMSNIFTLMPGDVIITGTPSGVGPLKSGDQLKAVLDNKYTFKSNVL
ncbi:MAG: 2-keto-4-pentenoate hydratase/2-oxohepta-3-ene-1,7-dioic acid hydratase in catechol pathway [Bermanella sp.]|jgi:2-keto-4-pentenoate hydratase/2-oxohepta-3-ene-1,7-dioic acid hydratase in catechol pathway